jgi:hypothetical protein
MKLQRWWSSGLLHCVVFWLYSHVSGSRMNWIFYNEPLAKELQQPANPSCSLYTSESQINGAGSFFGGLPALHCNHLQPHIWDAI